VDELDERARKIGLNEALFRQVNEKIQEVGERSGAVEEEPLSEILCECGDEHCTEQLEISIAEYQRVRSDAALFIIAPGHDAPSLEVVTVDADGYQVVSKRPGPPEQLARATEPT
jgi:hypothetical protein